MNAEGTGRGLIWQPDGPHLENAEGADDSSKYAKVTAQPQLIPGVKLALIRKWPGQRLACRIVSMTGQDADLPVLGDGCLALAKDVTTAGPVFGSQWFVDAFSRAPEKIEILVGGSLLDWDKPEGAEVYPLTPGVLTDSQPIASLVALMRALLDNLEQH